MIAKVAAARKLLTLVFYGLRDGEIRCLGREAAEQARTQPGRGSSIAVAPTPVARPSI